MQELTETAKDRNAGISRRGGTAAVKRRRKSRAWDVAQIVSGIRIGNLRCKKYQPALLTNTAVEDCLEKKHAGKLYI